MTDFLLVHDIGQGAWAWGKVWGYLTSRVEHPPRLAFAAATRKVVSLDMPCDSTAGLDTWVSAVTEAISSNGLRDLVLVAHGTAAPAVLQVAAQLDTPPKRVVLLAGVIPKDGSNALSSLCLPVQIALQNPVNASNMKIPKTLLNYYLCNDMDPMDAIQIAGRFIQIPIALLHSRVSLPQISQEVKGSIWEFGGASTSSFASADCPITYAVLWRDRLIPPESQRHMAERLPDTSIVEFNSCHQVTIERPREVADLLLQYT